jgi:aryl-alcohol dehydrogenase-like predicted oxidoreductase
MGSGTSSSASTPSPSNGEGDVADRPLSASNRPLLVRSVGTTALTLTRVGLGTWAMGGLGPRMTWGDVDDRESADTIRVAVDRGINWVDTAAMYGLGHSEEVLGGVLAGIPEPDRPYVSTKCGLRWGLAAKTLRIGAPGSLRWELDESLRRLRLEKIDLYFVHWPAEDGTPVEEYWAVLVEMRRQGKIGAAGLSNHNVGQVAAAEAIGHVDAVQPPFSAIEREAADELIPWCLAHNTAVVNYAPMQSGLLTGTFSEQRVAGLPDNDWRKTHPNFVGDQLQRNVALAEAMRPIADKHGSTVAAVAVAWTLAVPGVTSAIVGARRASQVASLLAAATLELDDDDLTGIAHAIEVTGAGRGPVPAPTSPERPSVGSWAKEA